MGGLPLEYAVATSSAFLGGVCYSWELKVAEGALGFDFTPWASNGDNAATVASDAWEPLSSGRSASFNHPKKMFDSIVDNAVHAVIDGGYTENTGIVGAIRAGAAEIVAVLVNVKGRHDEESFLSLFQGGETYTTEWSFTYSYSPVFQESHSDIKAKFNAFTKLSLATAACDDSTSHLCSISVGSIDATTANSTWLGVTSGRTVKIHVISFLSTLTIGYLEDFTKYASLAAEITTAITDDANKDIVNKVILPMFA